MAKVLKKPLNDKAAMQFLDFRPLHQISADVKKQNTHP